MVLCKGDVQDMIIRRLDRLWEATKGIDTIVMLPMVRYITAGCCDDSNHVRNRTEPDFLAKLRKDLEEFRIHLKRHLNGTGRSQCQVMDPTVDLLQLDQIHAWNADPAHPAPLGFDKMVIGVKAMEVRISERIRTAELREANKRPRLESSTGPHGQRGRGGGPRPPGGQGRGTWRHGEDSQGWSRRTERHEGPRNERHEGPRYGAYDIRRGGRF
jgi:hypothetical protein